MKLEWKIFKLRNFYYFKLNEYGHMLSINTESPKEYCANVKGTVYIFDSNTNQRTILKTLVPFLKYNYQLRTLAKRTVD
jgi:hypothetical protein